MAGTLRERYPEIEPHAAGTLDVGDGHVIAWEATGNPHGKPAVVLHGGPGAAGGPGLLRYHDPDAYRIILFDQRGCGRSRPLAGAPRADLSTNTTDHLLDDMERLRVHLGIDRWQLFGGSWGCVLGLAYAERHPERISEVVMMGLATGRREETELLTRGVAGLFPAAWRRFRDAVPPEDRDGDLAAAYARLLASPDPKVRDAAARAWCAWEDAMLPGLPPDDRFQDPVYRLGFARLVTHYWSHGSWLADRPVLGSLDRIAHIPAVLVQGELDLNNLVDTPWLLERGWRAAELVLVRAAGHSTSEGGMVDALISATDTFRR